MNDSAMTVAYHPIPSNKGKLIGQKPPLKLREIWALRTRLEMAGKTIELALFNLAIDSKLHGCDLVQLRVNDVSRGGEVLTRASVVQQKTGEPVRFELTDPTRVAIAAWMAKASLTNGSYLFPSRQHESLHLSGSFVSTSRHVLASPSGSLTASFMLPWLGCSSRTRRTPRCFFT